MDTGELWDTAAAVDLVDTADSAAKAGTIDTGAPAPVDTGLWYDDMADAGESVPDVEVERWELHRHSDTLVSGLDIGAVDVGNLAPAARSELRVSVTDEDGGCLPWLEIEHTHADGTPELSWMDEDGCSWLETTVEPGEQQIRVRTTDGAGVDSYMLFFDIWVDIDAPPAPPPEEDPI